MDTPHWRSWFRKTGRPVLRRAGVDSVALGVEKLAAKQQVMLLIVSGAFSLLTAEQHRALERATKGLHAVDREAVEKVVVRFEVGPMNVSCRTPPFLLQSADSETWFSIEHQPSPNRPNEVVRAWLADPTLLGDGIDEMYEAFEGGPAAFRGWVARRRDSTAH